MVRADSITCSPPHHQIPFWRFFVTLFIVHSKCKTASKTSYADVCGKNKKGSHFPDHLCSENHIRTKVFIVWIFVQKSHKLRSCTNTGCFNLITQCIVANIVGDEIIGKTIVWRVILSRFDRKCHGRTMFMGHTWRRFYSVMKTIDNTWSWFWKWSSDFCFLTLVNTSGRTTRKWGK